MQRCVCVKTSRADREESGEEKREAMDIQSDQTSSNDVGSAMHYKIGCHPHFRSSPKSHLRL